MKQRVAEQWSDLAGGLWSSLLLKKVAKEPFDFDNVDAESKKAFVSHCAETFDTHKDAVPDDVVRKMCARAGGTLDECETMQKELWKAYDKTELVPWCEKTFDWFAVKTGPRCLEKCPALYCKKRCSLYDKYQDLEDQEFAYMLRLNLTYTKEKRLNETKKELDGIEINIASFNKTKCEPAAAKVQDSVKLVNKLQDFIKNKLSASAVEKARSDMDKAIVALKAAREAQRTDKALVDATKLSQKADAAVGEAERALSSLKSNLEGLGAQLKDERAACDAKQQRVKDAKALLAKEEKAVTDYTTQLTKLKGETKDAKAKAEDFKKTKLVPAEDKVKAAHSKVVTLKERLSKEQQDLSEATSLYNDAKGEYDVKAAEKARAEEIVAEHGEALSNAKAKMEEAKKEVENAAKDVDDFNTTKHWPVHKELEKLDKTIIAIEESLESEKQNLIKAEYHHGRTSSDHAKAKSLQSWDKSKAAKDQLLEQEAKLADAEKALSDIATEIESLKSRLEDTSDAAELTRSKKAKLSMELSRLQTEQQLAEKAADRLEADIKETEAKAEEVKKDLEGLESACADAEKELKELEKKQTSRKETVSSTGLELAKAGDDEDAAHTALEPLEKQSKNMLDTVALKVKETSEAEANLAKSKDEVKYLNARLQDKSSLHTACSKEVKKLEDTQGSMKDDVSAAQTALTQAQGEQKKASASVDSIEKKLAKTVSEAQAKVDSTSDEYKKVSKSKSEYNDRLIEAQGKLTKAKIVYNTKAKVLDEMVSSFNSATKKWKAEKTMIEDKRKPILDALDRLKKDMAPYEKALAPMLA